MISAPFVVALANHIWQSTAVAAGIGLLTVTLRRNPARLRHQLWMVASTKFLVPFSMLFALGACLQPRTDTWNPQAPVTLMLGQITEPFSHAKLVTGAQHVVPELPTMPVQRSKKLDDLWSVLLLVWAGGTFTVIFAWSRKWLTIKALVRTAELITAGDNTRVLSSGSLGEPAVFGILRPVLILPEGIRARLSTKQLDAVIAHEFAHLRRRDNLTMAFHMFVEAIFWFHPLVWWIEKRLVEERELACDEAVLQGGNEPEAYAEGILNVCRAYLESPLPCVPGVTGADLKKRILRIAANQMTRKLDLARKLLLCAAGAFTVITPVAFGVLHVVKAEAQTATPNSPQDLSGIWQGTLHAPNGKDLRIVWKVTKADNGYTANNYSIDQTPMPIKVTSITLQGTEVKMSVLRIGGTYEGKMSPDGSTITGSWTQGQPMPLVMKRVNPDAAWPIPEPPPRPVPMAANANPEFDVATIKPSKPDQPGKGFMVRGRRFSTINTTLEDLMTFSYRLNGRQLVGLPGWATSSKFDLEAQPNGEGQPSDQQWRNMIQKLLAERFKLKFHNEQKELPVYALTVDKTGPKLTANHDNPNGLPGLGFRGLGDMMATNADMAQFSELLQGSVLDKPVIDQTGLKDKFDFQLKWTPDPTQFAGFGVKLPPPSTAPDAPPDLFAAMQQQLGLKLDSTKASVKVFVIDHVEQPSAN